MRHFFLLFSLLLFLAPLQSEGKVTVDSLRAQLSQMPDDTAKVDVMLQIINYFRMRNMVDSLKFYSTKTIQLSEQLNYYDGAIRAIQAEGLIEHSLGNFEEASRLAVVILLYVNERESKGQRDITFYEYFLDFYKIS